MKVSVIAPVLNERDSIESLLDALDSQSRRPDEIVVADGGSIDGTRQILEERAANDPTLIVIDGPGGISENRNAAIRAASHEAIACTDAGCVPVEVWLEKVVEPLEAGHTFVSGFFRPVGRTVASTSAGVAIMTVLDDVDPNHHVPAGNSMAFLKGAWEAVGGFPEGMRAAEDTLFGERMKERGWAPVFVPEALVHWSPPPSIPAMVAKSFRWGLEDGRAGLRRNAYLLIIWSYWAAVVMAVALAPVDPALSLLPLAFLAGLVAYRTKAKFKWVQGKALKYLLVPLAHLLQMLTQSLAWALGAARLRLWYLRKRLSGT